MDSFGVNLTDVLLETSNAPCAWCKTGGPPGTSHGMCKRHFISQMKEAGIPDEEIERMCQGREHLFSPDLGTDEPIRN